MYLDIGMPGVFGRFRVLLNGQDIQAVAADDKAGWVEVYRRDSKTGELIIENDTLVKQRLYGTVLIKWVGRPEDRERTFVMGAREKTKHA